MSALTADRMRSWCTAAGANNTVRQRITVLLSFLRWCSEAGLDIPDTRPIQRLRRSYPKTYGKVQDRYPGRWLTREEAFTTLLSTCDDTELGLRDELVLRLGLSGMRAAEIPALTLGSTELGSAAPFIHWTGKGRRPRRLTPSTRLLDALRRYLDLYAESVGDLHPDLPLLCRRRNGTRKPPRLDWGHALSPGSNAVWFIVHRHADAAGLGKVAPHDLRRSAAGILHRSTDASGAHHFDLLDIQKVLGHADPATTMRSYLDPMDTGVLDRAATLLD